VQEEDKKILIVSYYRCFRQYDIAHEKRIQELFNLVTKCEDEELTKLSDWIE